VIHTEATKFAASGRKVFLGVVVAMSLYLLAAHPTLARAQSDSDRGEPAESPRVSLPLQTGFARGGTALYITPEVGVDAAPGTPTFATAQQVAEGFNANFIPTNFSTLPGSPAVRDIFVFTTQGNILSATPIPPGPGNTNANYSPLWQVNLVAFVSGKQVSLLTSTADVTAAQAAGDVTVTKTPIIVECSVIFSLAPGGLLPGAKVVLEAPNAAVGGNVSSRVSLPLQVGFFNGARALYITPEVGVDALSGSSIFATAQQIAVGFNSNFIPQNFATLPGSPAVDDIFVFTNSTQGNVLASAPHPAGPTNTDTNYSPLWQISQVTWNPGRTRRVLTSQSEILSAESAGDVSVQKTPIVVECSVIFTPGGGLLPGARITRDDDEPHGDT
jgi:hypothetical protein